MLPGVAESLTLETGVRYTLIVAIVLLLKTRVRVWTVSAVRFAKLTFIYDLFLSVPTTYELSGVPVTDFKSAVMLPVPGNLYVNAIEKLVVSTLIPVIATSGSLDNVSILPTGVGPADWVSGLSVAHSTHVF